MRKFFYLSLSLLAIMLGTSSCDWLLGESDTAPTIYTSVFFVNPIMDGDSIISAKDTLYAHQTNEMENSYRIDSVSLGDTVIFASTYYTYERDIVSILVEWDSLRMDFTMDIQEEISKHLTSQSNIAEGKLIFNPGFNRVSFPCYFIIKDYGILPLRLTVASTSQFSPTSVRMTIPVKR